MESKKADDIKNLLLKIIIPLAFPLAGSFICGLIADRANRNSGIDSSDCSIQLDPSSHGSSSSGGEEEEVEEMDSLNSTSRKLVKPEIPSRKGKLINIGCARQASVAEEIMVVEATEGQSEVAANKNHEENRVEEAESLKSVVSALEERATSIESQFHNYCEMKEQESTYQKMQIMCLGMKLELLESQNQRLEAAAAEIRAAAEEFAAMRANVDALQRKFKKISKRSKQEFDAIDGRILALDAKEAEMARRCEEFEQHIKEMKQLTLQLQREIAANHENVEVIVERSMQKLSSSKDLRDGLEELRDRWAADMEEMIYLGWITAWLQHDLLVNDGEGGSTVAIDDDGLPATEHKKGEKMVASAGPSNEVELCKTSSNASTESTRATGVESCMGLTGCRTGIGRPRLLRKLRGWAGGKGPSKGGRPGGIEGPSSSRM